jgi:hypothetical protein
MIETSQATHISMRFMLFMSGGVISTSGGQLLMCPKKYADAILQEVCASDLNMCFWCMPATSCGHCIELPYGRDSPSLHSAD